MKRSLLLLLALSLLTIAAIAQKKSKGYLRISPTLYIPNDYDPAPGGTITGMIGFSQYFGMGLGFGVIKLQDMKPIIPIGGELVITNFKATKVAPIVSLGASFPAYNERSTRGGSGYTVDSKGSGRLQLQGSAGIVLPSTKKASLTFAGGYSLLQLRNRIETRTFAPGQPSTKTIKDLDIDVKMFFISIGILLK